LTNPNIPYYYRVAFPENASNPGVAMLTLREMLVLMGGEMLTPGLDLNAGCSKVFASDLMSDVLAFSEPGSILITGLVNAHVVRTACLVDAMAIIVVQGKRPDTAVVAEAAAKKMPIIATGCSMFEACSRISRSLPGDRP
jgi:predicted transcriptional regulator